MAPPGAQVIYACYRLYGHAFTDEIMEARRRWEEASRERRAARREAEP